MRKIILLAFCIVIILSCFISCKEQETITPSYSPIATMKTYSTPKPTENLKSKIDVEFLKSEHSYEYYIVTYKITNNSTSHIFKYIEIKVSLLDSAKNVLTSDWTYAVGSEGLAPNESNEFEIIIKEPIDGDVEYFRYEVLDFS